MPATFQAAKSEAFLQLLLNLLSRFGDNYTGVANIENTGIDFVESDEDGNGFAQVNVTTPEGHTYRVEVEYVPDESATTREP